MSTSSTITRIVKTSAGRLYRVTETGDANLAHVWMGIEVKHVAGHWSDELNTNVGPQWVAKKNARPALVRKAATRIVEAA